MLFGKKRNVTINKDELLEEIQDAQQKCLRLEKKFYARAAAEDNIQLALSCRQCAEALDECAELVRQMLPVRDRRKARVFEAKSKRLLREAADAIRDCKLFDHPINANLVPITDELKSLILDITMI